MSINKLTDSDFKWHASQPDVPGWTADVAKAFFDAPTQILMGKVNEIIDKKQDALTAGDGIVISDDTIASNSYYVIDHLDLSKSEIAELSKECVDNKKILVYAKAGTTQRNVCTQVHYSTATTLVFWFIACSKNGPQILYREVYNINSGSHTENDYTLVTGSKESGSISIENVITRDNVLYDKLDPNTVEDFDNYVAGAQATLNYVEDQITASRADYVCEVGSDGIWTYRKWNSGVYEAWCHYETSITLEQWQNVYGCDISLSAPSFSKSVTNCFSDNTVVGTMSWGAVNKGVNAFTVRFFSAWMPESGTGRVNLMIKGTWK